MEKLKRDNYICVQGWMVTELNLKGNELLIYAIIYGFSQSESQKYSGSCAYLAEWVSSSKQTVYSALQSLVNKGLVQKYDRYENGVKFCDYVAKKESGGKETLEGESKNLIGVVKNFDRGGQKSLHHNKEDIKEQNKEEKKERKKESTASYDLIINEYTNDVELRDVLFEFIKMRKLIKSPMTDRALRSLLKKLDELASTNADKIATVEQSIVNNWKSVYPLKKDAANKQRRIEYVEIDGRTFDKYGNEYI